ncbi:DUF4179 domain-containing protein, partial [Clostridium tarantellae]
MNKFDDNKFNNELKEKAKNFSIEVPESLKVNVLNTLENLPERKKKRKKSIKAAGFTALVIASFIGFNGVMPVYAEKLPLIGPTFKSINSALGVGEKYVAGSKNVNLVQTYDDTSITIKNMYYDGVEFAIAYEIKSDKGFKDKPVLFPLIKKGFKYLEYDNELHKGEFIDKNTYVGLASYVFDERDSFDKGNINLIINDIYGEWVGYSPEKFKFNLHLDSKNMGKKIYKLNNEFTYDDNNFKFINVISSPFNTIINSEFDVNNIKIKNNKDKSVAKYELTFKVIDDKGMPLDFKTGSSSSKEALIGSTNKGLSSWRFSGVKEDTKSITIIPILYKMQSEINNDENLILKKLNNHGETQIKLNNNEEYLIKNIDFKEDKTLVNVNVKKYLYTLNSPDISFRDENKNEIDIEDTTFNGIDDGYNFTLTLPKLDENKTYYIPIY